MKVVTVEITRFEANQNKSAKWWEVGFTLTNDKGHTYYAPTTVYEHEVSTLEDTTMVVVAAMKKALYGQLATLLTETDDGLN